MAKKLQGKRVTRGADFSESDVDIKLPDFPSLKIDCKLRADFYHHALFKDIKEKYVKVDGDIPMMVTREGGKSLYLAVVDLDFFAKLLDCYRKAMKSNASS